MNHRTKLLRAYSQYRNTGILDRMHIESLIPEKIINKLSSAELVLVMQALDKAYQDAKRSPKD